MLKDKNKKLYTKFYQPKWTFLFVPLNYIIVLVSINTDITLY